MYNNLTLTYYVVQVEFLKINYLEKTYISLLGNKFVLKVNIFRRVNSAVTLINQGFARVECLFSITICEQEDNIVNYNKFYLNN